MSVIVPSTGMVVRDKKRPVDALFTLTVVIGLVHGSSRGGFRVQR